MKTVKTHKAGRSDWREKVMMACGLSYEIVNNQIIYKGELSGYKTLVDFLVSKRIELNISAY